MGGKTVSKQVNRREFLSLAATGAGMVVLAACAPKTAEKPAEPTAAPTKAAEEPTVAAVTPESTPPPAATGPVEIHVSNWGDVADKVIGDGAAAAFAKTRSDIKIIPDIYAGEYYDKIKVNFAGGTPSDLVYIEGYRWQPFVSQVIPLDDYIKKDSMAKAWPDVPNYNILTTWRGKVYMSVIDTGSMPMMYNKKLFDKAGVPYPKQGWTFAEFKEAVVKLSFEDNGTKYYGYSGGYGGVYAYVWAVPFLRMDGKLEFDTLAEPKEAKWTQPEIVDAIQFVSYDCVAKGYAPSAEAAQAGGVGFGDGRVALDLNGPWALPYIYGPDAPQGTGLSFDAVDVPVGSLGKPMADAEIQGHMIAKDSKNKDAAWEVLKYWTGDEMAKITAENGRMCGTPEQTEKFWVPIASKKFNFESASVFAQAQLHGQCPMVGGAGANYDALNGPGGPILEAFDALQANTKTAKQAFEEANPKIQKLLDDYWAKQS